MRLLCDEQLSEDLSVLLRDVFPDALHVRQIGASGAADLTVWQLAQDRGCLLVTKDEDFHRLSILLDHLVNTLGIPAASPLPRVRRLNQCHREIRSRSKAYAWQAI